MLCKTSHNRGKIAQKLYAKGVINMENKIDGSFWRTRENTKLELETKDMIVTGGKK
jgi:hypothetical protein